MEFSPGFQWTYAHLRCSPSKHILGCNSFLFISSGETLGSFQTCTETLYLLDESPLHFPGWHFAVVYCHSVETWETDRHAQHKRYLLFFTFVPDTIPYIRHWSKNHNSLVAREVKSLPAVWETWVGKIPCWREWLSTPIFLPDNPMDRDAWWATVHGVTKSWTCLSN